MRRIIDQRFKFRFVVCSQHGRTVLQASTFTFYEGRRSLSDIMHYRLLLPLLLLALFFSVSLVGRISSQPALLICPAAAVATAFSIHQLCCR
ncbi:hypothetical protein JKP88DRAFT_101246 [Tribonema minus]|uniref:Uncharacterized protein n=1 Tax=Tribonema minus TaxID=303371 RepID=A0A835YGD8_9STRA|nr:hypothetical protein JKP88DRAFT_101246 [Tribonema minus]